MKFITWLEKKSPNEKIRYCALFVSDHIDFPHISRWANIERYLLKNNTSEEIWKNFAYVWNEFSKCKYATISTHNSSKRIPRIVKRI